MSDFEMPNEPVKAKVGKAKVTPEPVVEEVQELPDLEKPKYSQDELLEIFDELIFSNEYRETVTIKDKLKVTFKSRSVDETNDVASIIDDSRFNLVSTYNQQLAVLNLAHSLVNYNGKDLSTLTPQERAKFIGKMNAFVMAEIIKALSDFDDKVSSAVKEGEENF